MQSKDKNAKRCQPADGINRAFSSTQQTLNGITPEDGPKYSHYLAADGANTSQKHQSMAIPHTSRPIIHWNHWNQQDAPPICEG